MPPKFAILPNLRRSLLAYSLLWQFASACSGGKEDSSAAAAKADIAAVLTVDGKVSWDSTTQDGANGPGLGGLDSSAEKELPQYDGAANCPGGSLCPCTQNTDCQSGLCLEDPNAAGGNACAQPCKPGCPAGYVCANLTSGSSDIQQICVFRAARLCNPCATDKDCEVTGLIDSKCVDQGELGRFCGVACTASAGDCPADYVCQTVSATGGGKFPQCVRKADAQQTPFGVCPCNAAAIVKELQTTCAVVGKYPGGGAATQCPGVRKCLPQGLSVCLGTAATPEVCDGTDNDCDGQTDETGCDDTNPCTIDNCLAVKGCAHENLDGIPCDADGSNCTPGDVCKLGVCTAGIPVDCNDGNPCTADTCDPGKGCLHSNADGLPCSDDNQCTQGDVCGAGQCKPGVPKVCTAADGCQTAKCDLASGSCSYASAPDKTPCNDGLTCTDQDQCAFGSCTGQPKYCNDDNPCTSDGCDPKSGCSFMPQGAVVCDDGNACTSGDICTGGVCGGVLIDVAAPLAAKGCNDGNPCTVDSCSPIVGCMAKPMDGQPCDDGEPCTLKDECQNGKCISGSYQCECKVDADCMAKEDGNFCNGTLVCGKVGPLPQCVLDPKSVVQCDASGDSTCVLSACAPVTGKCVAKPEPDGKTCSDGNACTLGDVCAKGKCAAGKQVDCNDGNACTADSCDGKAGCAYLGQTGAGCDADGTVCTQGDACQAGVCTKGKAVVCDDGNPCTIDSCDAAKGCVGVAIAEKAPCANGAPTTWCLGGKCVPAPYCGDGIKNAVGEDCDLGAANGKGACSATCKVAVTAMAIIPAGKFWMGCVPGDSLCAADEFPVHEVYLADFLIDLHEVSVQEYANCVDLGLCTAPKCVSNNEPMCNWGNPARLDHPVNGTDRAQAQTYCALQGKRLPTEAEWEKAARGGCELAQKDCKLEINRNPWGNSPPECQHAWFGNGSGPCSNVASTGPVGGKPAGNSPYGLADCTGNVWEWVSDEYGDNYYLNSPVQNPKGPASGGPLARGGNFHGSILLEYRISIRKPLPDGYFSHGVGFRCAKSLP